MTDERDPALQALFAEAEQELAPEGFSTRVMTRLESARRRTVAGWIIAGLVLLSCLWFLAAPLQYAAYQLTGLLATPLINPDEPLLLFLLLPVNNVSTLLVLGLIGLVVAFRKLV